MFYIDQKGIKLKNHDLYLDANRVVPFSFISHGHSDHLRNHKKVLATPPTIEFFKIRFESRVKKPEFIPLNYFEKYELDGLDITLYPAGHILGSAMILIEQNGTRLLYSGDFKLQANCTAEPISIPKADILIMESTFGHPDYRFHSKRSKVPQHLINCIETIRNKRKLPVIMAYSLGKAQEAMVILGEMDYKIFIHSSAWKLAEIYRKFEIVFPNCSLYEEYINLENDILIVPPHLVRHLYAQNLPPFETIFLSGWAEKSPSTHWISSDYALPLSDHADFDELIEFVKRVNPKKVFTLHGFPDFPNYLKEAGFEAEFLHNKK